jgi:acetyl-CoA acetyltransferase
VAWIKSVKLAEITPIANFALTKFAAATDERHITVGNAPGLNDAAAAMVLADGPWAEKRALPATARLVSYGRLMSRP